MNEGNLSKIKAFLQSNQRLHLSDRAIPSRQRNQIRIHVKGYMIIM
jgi:hypothetical protein